MAATFPGLKVLIYSGDQDIDTNPSFLTQTCLHELSDVRGNATRAWASWKVNDWRKCSRSAARLLRLVHVPQEAAAQMRATSSTSSGMRSRRWRVRGIGCRRISRLRR